MMGWYGTGWGAGAWVGMVMMVLVWGGLIALAAWAVTRLSRGDAPRTTTESPRQILDRRFASGDIDAEQYARARHVLDGRSPVGPDPRG